jgi:hypothetical protein
LKNPPLAARSAVYDALGREVQVGVSGGWGPYDTIYAPDGSRLGLMNGASPYGIDIPLPGGAEAVYNAAVLVNESETPGPGV